MHTKGISKVLFLSSAVSLMLSPAFSSEVSPKQGEVQKKVREEIEKQRSEQHMMGMSLYGSMKEERGQGSKEVNIKWQETEIDKKKKYIFWYPDSNA